jgi:hypothetical protein
LAFLPAQLPDSSAPRKRMKLARRGKGGLFSMLINSRKMISINRAKTA